MHRIRLVGTWKWIRDSQHIVVSRQFHRPTGLVLSDQVALVVRPRAEHSPVAATLNDRPLQMDQQDGLWRAEITDILKDFNTWSIQFSFDSVEESVERCAIGPQHPLIVEAYLEIKNRSAG